jgi:regulator of protease activity HflC (stomatin/prohibitin superfamily)
MIKGGSQLFVDEYLWRLLAHITPDHPAFLVHPGSTLPPVRLAPGWRWHWPLLSSIRVLSLTPFSLAFSSGEAKGDRLLQDDAITAVTRDHRLFTIEGAIQLQLNADATDTVLAKFNHHSTNRLLRPLIRQAIRETVGQQPSHRIQPHSIEHEFKQTASLQLQPYGVKVLDCTISSIKSFNPPVTQKTLG